MTSHKNRHFTASPTSDDINRSPSQRYKSPDASTKAFRDRASASPELEAEGPESFARESLNQDSELDSEAIFARLRDPTPRILSDAPVFANLRRIADDLEREFDSSMSWEVLSAPQTTYAVIRPLALRYAHTIDHSLIYCLLVNRVAFSRKTDGTAFGLNRTRADACEVCRWSRLLNFELNVIQLIAIRLIKIWAELGLTELVYWYESSLIGVLLLIKLDV